MTIAFPVKDPDEVLDYVLDWSLRILTDTITTSLWIVPTGITKDSDDFDDSTTTIWLSGGTIGTAYVMTNRIETADGRTMDQSCKIKIKTK